MMLKIIPANIKDKNMQSALHMAVEKRHVETVEVILARRDVKIDAGGFFNFTPLHYAVLKVHVQYLKADWNLYGRMVGFGPQDRRFCMENWKLTYT